MLGHRAFAGRLRSVRYFSATIEWRETLFIRYLVLEPGSGLQRVTEDSQPREVILVAGRDPRHELSGGHSSYVRAHARAALMAGYEPHIFCVASSAEVISTDYGVVHRVHSTFRPFRQLMIAGHARPLGQAIANYALLPGHKPPLVHAFGVWGYAGWLAVRSLKRRGNYAALVVSSYTTYEEESRAKVRGARDGYPIWDRLRFGAEHLWIRAAVEWFERAAYVEADTLLINYESVRRLIDAKYGLGERCLKIPYSSEDAFPKERDSGFREVPAEISRLRPSHAPLIVAVSRHDPRKGVDVLINALAALKKKGTPFRACLVGGGPLLERHRTLVRAQGLHDCVSVPGVVALAGQYNSMADVFVLPSREEQSGSLAVIDALGAGIAVVASRVDGLIEDLEHEKDALLVTPGDAAALEAALGRLLKDSELRRRLGMAGRHRFEERFAPAQFARAIGEVYSSFAAPLVIDDVI